MVSRITALTIQTRGDDVQCEALGQEETSGLWIGVINLYRNQCFHTTLLSTVPMYKTSEKAVQAMKDFVKQIRATPLTA